MSVPKVPANWWSCKCPARLSPPPYLQLGKLPIRMELDTWSVSIVFIVKQGQWTYCSKRFWDTTSWTFGFNGKSTWWSQIQNAASIHTPNKEQSDCKLNWENCNYTLCNGREVKHCNCDTFDTRGPLINLYLIELQNEYFHMRILIRINGVKYSIEIQHCFWFPYMIL